MKSAPSPVMSFGPYRLDAAKRVLLRGGERLPVPPKVFDALVILVENRDRVLGKDELLAALWPGVTVTEASLKQLVSSLRKLLGDSGQEYVENLPKVGYRFCAPVTVLAAAAEETTPAPETGGRRVRPRLLAIALGILLATIAVRGVAGLLSRSFPKLTSLPASAHRERPEVRALIARGRHHWLDRSGDGLFKAMLSFRKATELDPASANAWSGLAGSYAFDVNRWRESEALAAKALQLSPSLAAPRATLGFVAMAWRWDMVYAGFELTRAIEADPEDATTRQWHALYLTLKGQLPEAQLELEEASQRHPASVPLLCDLARVLYIRGLLPEARQTLSTALDLDPTFINSRRLRFEMAVASGELDQAVSALLDLPALLDQGSAEERRREAAALGPARFLEKHTLAYPQLYPDGAGVLAVLGRTDTALAWLESSLAAHAFLLPAVRVDPLFAPLRDDPRFQSFLTRLSGAVRAIPDGGAP